MSDTSDPLQKSLQVTPGRPLLGEVGNQGTLALPGDKSLSHRAALFAALAAGESRIGNFLIAGVTRAMLDGLSALDVPWQLHGKTLTVLGKGLSGWQPPVSPVEIYCGNSATTLRLLAGALAAWGFPSVLDGSAGLRRRPMGRIVEPLQQMGVQIQATDGCAPLHLDAPGKPLQAIDYRLPVASAQVKSCLLLAALAARGTTVLREPAPSRDHTERMLRSMGVMVLTEPGGVTQIEPPAGALKPLQITLPGDMSAAAFLIVAALITPGSRLMLRQVGMNPGRTGLIEALQRMGGDIQITGLHEHHGEPVGDITVAHGELHAVRVGGDLVVRMIDEFPAFAIAAAFAQGETVVEDASELRHKESDRIADLAQELAKLGVQMSETADGFRVLGGRPVQGGEVQPHGDHRLAMTLAVAGLAARSPVAVQQAGIIGESFPQFPQLLNALGAEVSEL